MLFKKAFLSILAGAALTVLASPVPAVAGDSLLDTRATDPFKSLGTAAEFARLAKFCGTSTSKRDLEERTATSKGDNVHDVGTGKFNAAMRPMGLMTKGLITCMGVVVVGTPPASNPVENARFLMHMYAAEGSLYTLWQEFAEAVKKAKTAGLTDLKAYVRTPDLTAAKPMKSDGAPLDWITGDATLSKKILTELESLIKSELGVTPKVVTSPMVPAVKQIGDAGSMEVSGTDTENNVYVDGKKIS